jgi:hypothetical protein
LVGEKCCKISCQAQGRTMCLFSGSLPFLASAVAEVSVGACLIDRQDASSMPIHSYIVLMEKTGTVL